jgi:hypothetical protein
MNNFIKFASGSLSVLGLFWLAASTHVKSQSRTLKSTPSPELIAKQLNSRFNRDSQAVLAVHLQQRGFQCTKPIDGELEDGSEAFTTVACAPQEQVTIRFDQMQIHCAPWSGVFGVRGPLRDNRRFIFEVSGCGNRDQILKQAELDKLSLLR